MTALLESGSLAITVAPNVGGTITKIIYKQSGLSILGEVPWSPIAAPLDPPLALDEPTWLTRYTGGWPLLFPNGGDACVFDGRRHGFHGEASIAPWSVEQKGSSLHLQRDFTAIPVSMRRVISLDDDLLTIEEEAVAREPVTVMWGHHPTFGTDLLDGDFEIGTGAQSVIADSLYDPPASPLRPGAKGSWPYLAGKQGTLDLRYPGRLGEIASLAYLTDFNSPWISIRRRDNAVAALLSWDDALFPHAWFWCELGGTTDAPWRGKARLIGLEPNTTCFGGGIAEASRRGENLLRLEPGKTVKATIRLQVFKPKGPVTGIDATGRASGG